MFNISAREHLDRTVDQSGFTLPELMISSALGLILVAAMINMYVSAKSSYVMNSAKTQLYAESRATLRILGRTIEHAGYRNLDSITKNEALTFPASGAFKENQVLVARGSSSGGWRLQTRYQSDTDGLIGDCLGQTHPVGILVTQRLDFDPDTMTLTCQRSCSTPTGASACTTESVTISERLNTIELLVGSAALPDARVVERYELIQNLTASPDNILAIKTIAWFESSQNVLDRASEQTLNAFSDTIKITDRKLRTIVSDTFAVRNRLP